MPLYANAFWRPCLRTTGHNSIGTNSTAGQPRLDAVMQMRSISHFQSVALRHQYASDCLMRPFLTTRYLPCGLNRHCRLKTRLADGELAHASDHFFIAAMA